MTVRGQERTLMFGVGEHGRPISLEWTDGIPSQQRNFPYFRRRIVIVEALQLWKLHKSSLAYEIAQQEQDCLTFEGLSL